MFVIIILFYLTQLTHYKYIPNWFWSSTPSNCKVNDNLSEFTARQTRLEMKTVKLLVEHKSVWVKTNRRFSMTCKFRDLQTKDKKDSCCVILKKVKNPSQLSEPFFYLSKLNFCFVSGNPETSACFGNGPKLFWKKC